MSHKPLTSELISTYSGSKTDNQNITFVTDNVLL